MIENLQKDTANINTEEKEIVSYSLLLCKIVLKKQNK